MSDAPASPALFYFGASHHTAPLEVRERLALGAEKAAEFLQRATVLEGVREFALLNTCNRVEFYGVVENPDAIARLEYEFCAFQQLPVTEFEAIRQRALGAGALQHLLEVCAGLDSQMLGETEILGQVKDAYAAAQARRGVGPVLNRVFQKTFQHAKYVRSHTALTEGQISVANVAVDLALKIFGRLGETRILLLGAGDIGEKTAKAFQSRGAKTLTVASRTLSRAMELARTFDGSALPFENVTNHFSEFDVVVCSTAAPTAVVNHSDVAAAMKRRRAQPLFFIDLALPRDVDPAVVSLENVFVYNLDDLARIADENRAAREAQVERAREIVRAKTEALWKQIEPHAPARTLPVARNALPLTGSGPK